MCIKSMTHNCSFYQFIYGYMFHLLLQAIISPFINVHTGEIILQ
jgi:hypothetical protein